MKSVNTYGAEIEKTVAALKNSNSYPVSQNFFKRLKKAADKRGVKSHYHFSDIKPKTILGVVSDDLAEQGLDNGFNLLETSLKYRHSLTELVKFLGLDLKTTQQALLKEDASIINLSIHPLGKRDMRTYKKMVVPKGVYKYIWYRGWDHSAGIDARAQNSPTTGVSVWEAAGAVSAIIGAGAAFVALFANGPFEEGKISSYKDARLNMWDRMMKGAKVAGDRITTKFPPKKFRTLADYFTWMFSGKTGIHFVLAENTEGKTDYKGIGERILIVNGNPAVLSYLSKSKWNAQFFKNIQKGIKKTVVIKPTIIHMEAMQFAQFIGARIRYGLNHKDFPIEDFVKACKQQSKFGVEEIFDRFAKFIYIEGRDAGASFPDIEILLAGKDIAESVVISPSAVQTGLIKNLAKVTKYLNKFEWSTLGKLREAAIKDGLQGQAEGIKVKDFTEKILELAAAGLDAKERWMLNYPFWVLETGENGADRAIKFVNKFKGNLNNALVELVKSRKVML